MIEEAQIVVHEAYEPDSIADFLDPDVLTGEDGAEVELTIAEAEASARGDSDGSVVEGVLQFAEPAIGAR